MTNGEKIQKDFKGCEVCEPIVEDDIIHVIFADKKDSAIGFDWSWWNAEYKEPTTMNCESCRYYGSHHEVCNYCYKCSLWTEKESTTKDNLGVDLISREQAKTAIRDKFKNLSLRVEINTILNELPSVTQQLSSGLEKNSKKLEKNFGELDCISRADALALYCDKCGVYNCISKCSSYRAVEKMSSVTPHEPKTGHWVKYGIPRCGEQHYKCTNCDEYFNFGLYSDYYKKAFKFCPNCGCAMVESQESEENNDKI